METFKKLPLGGVDRRSLVGLLAEKGADVAREQLARERKQIKSAGTAIADDMAVLILGGSNGITRALVNQLLFGEGAAVFCVHYDSVKMQIGGHHAAAISEAASEAGLSCEFFNRDATRDKTIAEVIDKLKDRYRAVHFINGIAAGVTKRYEKHGPTKVRDLDMAFDPVLQVPDFQNAEAYRQLGWVEVGVATEAEIERTNKFMGTSSKLWVDPLAEAGLIASGESVVGFCDYDYEADDPVYGLGPLAGAKVLQRETMTEIKQRHGARTMRICYPAMATTALGAIPGGGVMFAVTAEILKERDQYRTIPELAAASMAVWKDPLPESELRLDDDFQAILPEFHRRAEALTPADVPGCFEKLLETGF